MDEDLKTLIKITGGDPNDCKQLYTFAQFDLSFALRLIWSTKPNLSPKIEADIKKWFEDNGKGKELVDWNDTKG